MKHISDMLGVVENLVEQSGTAIGRVSATCYVCPRGWGGKFWRGDVVDSAEVAGILNYQGRGSVAQMGDALTVVLGDMALEELLLNKVTEVFIGKVDGKLVEGIGSESEVLGSGKVEKANEGDKVISTGVSVDLFIKP
jgi:hypothetical protein